MPNTNLKLHHDYTNVKVLYAHEQSLGRGCGKMKPADLLPKLSLGVFL